MMRSFTWAVVGAIILGSSMPRGAYGQGPPPYGYGGPVPASWNSMPVQSNDLTNHFIQLNTMQFMGSLGAFAEAAVAPAPAMPGSPRPAAGPTPAPPFTGGLMPAAYVEGAPPTGEASWAPAVPGAPPACAGTPEFVMPTMQLVASVPPAPPHEKRSPLSRPPAPPAPPNNTPFWARFDGTFLMETTYRSTFLNLLWRTALEPIPDTPYCRWATFEYLNWRTTEAPIAVPLVTGNNNPLAFGTIGEAGTSILFGSGSNQSTDFGPFSGGRLTFGKWCDLGQTVGVEVSAFALANRELAFNASSPTGTTGPIVAVPFFAAQSLPAFGFVASESSLSGAAGGAGPNSLTEIAVNLSSSLWGTEANLVFDPSGDKTGTRNDYSPGALRMLAILGFRYLDLAEELTLATTIFDPFSTGVGTTLDSFGTRNQFYGGQVGMRLGKEIGRWFLDLGGKIALGSNHQTLTINGLTTVSPPDAFAGTFTPTIPSGSTPGGIFAQPSNIGQYSRNVFAILPEAQAKLAYEFSSGIRPFVGYNVMYLNNVIRPGNQIDRNINETQIPFGRFPAVVGTPVPVANFHSSDFWAMGWNVGVEIRY